MGEWTTAKVEVSMSARLATEHKEPPRMSVWRTADVDERERFAYWREAVCDAFLELSAETTSPANFSGEIVRQQRSDLSVALVESAVRESAATVRCEWSRFGRGGLQCERGDHQHEQVLQLLEGRRQG